MNYEIKVRPIGNSYGLVLPKEILTELEISSGDKLFLSVCAGGFKASVYDEEYVETMKAAAIVMHKRRNLLKALADS
jgi:putative addiction module antidote